MTLSPGQIVAERRLLALPETLVLLATDARPPSAWLDVVAYAALLAELRLAGCLSVRSDTLVQRTGASPQPSRVRWIAALNALSDEPFAAEDGITAVAAAMPDLRDALTTAVAPFGGLVAVHRDTLRTAIDAGPAIRPRFGILLALANAIGLVPTLMPKHERPAAVELAQWVAERDAMTRGALALLATQRG